MKKQQGYGLIGIILMTAIFGAIGFSGWYVWNRNQANSIENLHMNDSEPQLDQPEASDGLKNSVLFESKTGGLKLNLPNEYVVIVEADGNKGGAPGATYKIAKKLSDNVVEDNVYSFVQIDIDHIGSRDFDSILQSQLSRLKDQGDVFENINTKSTSVAGEDAALITADGNNYSGDRAIYLLVSGEFSYTITSTGEEPQDADVLKAVLDGISVEAVSL